MQSNEQCGATARGVLCNAWMLKLVRSCHSTAWPMDAGCRHLFQIFAHHISMYSNLVTKSAWVQRLLTKCIIHEYLETCELILRKIYCVHALRLLQNGHFFSLHVSSHLPQHIVFCSKSCSKTFFGHPAPGYALEQGPILRSPAVMLPSAAGCSLQCCTPVPLYLS